MSDPRSWLEDDAPPAVVRLLSAARAEQPSEASLGRTLSAVGAGAAAASATTAAGAAVGQAGASAVGAAKLTPMLGATSVLKWLLFGASLGGAFVAVGPGLDRKPQPGQATNQGTAGVAVGARARVSTKAVKDETALGTPVAAPGLIESSSKTVAPPTQRQALANPATRVEALPRSPPAIDTERLAEEVRAIDAASSSLASGRAAQSLGTLNEYDRLFPEHRFAPEALYLRMEALLQLGRTADARSAAERLLTSYPRSPQAARARLVLSETIP